MKLEDILVNINGREIRLHCPGCGSVNFYKPKTFQPDFCDWWRCRKCKLDMAFTEEGYLKMVMEDDQK